MHADRPAWRDTSVAYRPRRSGTRTGAGRHDDYMPNSRREIAAIGLRIAGAFSIVLILAGSAAYLLIRMVT